MWLSGAKPLDRSTRKRDFMKGEVTRYVGIFDELFRLLWFFR